MGEGMRGREGGGTGRGGGGGTLMINSEGGGGTGREGCIAMEEGGRGRVWRVCVRCEGTGEREPGKQRNKAKQAYLGAAQYTCPCTAGPSTAPTPYTALTCPLTFPIGTQTWSPINPIPPAQPPPPRKPTHPGNPCTYRTEANCRQPTRSPPHSRTFTRTFNLHSPLPQPRRGLGLAGFGMKLPLPLPLGVGLVWAGIYDPIPLPPLPSFYLEIQQVVYSLVVDLQIGGRQ